MNTRIFLTCFVTVFYTIICSSDQRPNRSINTDLLRNSSVSPCNDHTWGYSNITGRCYMFVEDPTESSWTGGRDKCQQKPGESQLLIIDDAATQKFIEDELLRYNYEPHWIGAKKIDGVFKWASDNTAVTYTNWDVGEPKNTGDCVYITREGVEYEWRWRTASCTQTYNVYCQQEARHCPAIPTADFLQPSFPKPNVEQTITFSCTPGYQMPDYEARYEKWSSDFAANKTNDTEPYWKVNPSLSMHCDYDATWTNTTPAVAPCEPTSCEEVPVVKYAKANDTVTRVYPTWTQFKCDHGYYYKDINSRIKVGYCGPDVKWHNVPRQCDPVPCDPFPMPGNATSPNDHMTFFGDVIAYRCKAGHMFPDGAVWKFVACRQNFVTTVIGRWNESEPFPPCEKLKCPNPPTGENVIQLGNGTEHNTRINYTCYDGYEFPDSSTTVIVECSNDAVWKPKLAKCNAKPAPLPTTGKKYQPPTVDAPGASSIGSTSMIVVIIMLVILVLLDITTISRDIKLLKSNLKHLKRRLVGRKTT